MNKKLTLSKGAPKVLEQLVGNKMDTWIVGQTPVGHLKDPISNKTVRIDQIFNILLDFFYEGTHHGWESSNQSRPRLVDQI